MNKCYLCGATTNIEIHHIYSNNRRKASTLYGLVVPLCMSCHRGSNGVHQNAQKMHYLRVVGQQKFRQVYPNIDFVSIFHKNYLEEVENDDRDADLVDDTDEYFFSDRVN